MSRESGEYVMADIIKKRKVLIAEDNPVNLTILKKILQDDYDVITAQNGKIALNILNSTQGKTISAIVLDIVMPVMDGYEVLSCMKKDERLSHIPVIVASSENSEGAEIKALSLGANDYVLKPYKPEIIRHRISNTIFLRETSAFVNSVQNDKLTGVYGKDYFYLQATQILQANPNRKYDLICLDVERFKLVNDMYGMQVGDELLINIGKTLLNEINNYGICGRIGSDEFACLIPHREDYSNEMFIESINKINSFSSLVKLSLVLRYGIYIIENTTTPINIICDRACLAKDSIKGKYDTYFAVYDDTIRQKLLNEQMIVSEMKTALADGQFKVYFQPKYNLKTEQIVGAEALVRWIHPILGFMSPAEFIPLFEKNGFITDLDIYVWEQCCQKMKAWRDKGHIVTPVSVNVSRADIYNEDLPDILISMIQKYELSPMYLHLEITESAYTENPEQLIAVIHKVKKLGFIIEMDDFGTGYSSLNMLSELPIDILKLDIRFIQKVKRKNNDRSILSFIISLAKWMDLKVVTEGVESEDQIQLLKSLSCEYAQGYYYAKPLPQELFEQHLLQSEVQVVSNTADNTFFNKKKKQNEKPIILLWDVNSIDNINLQTDIGDLYYVNQVFTVEQCQKFLKNNAEKITMVIISFSSDIPMQQLELFIQICKKESMPVVMICNTDIIEQDKIFSLDVSGFVTRPYHAGKLKFCIRNAIAFEKIERYEQQKELNAALIEMRKRAERDALTELFNRAEFEVRVDNFFYKNDNPIGIFIIIDIDNFKSVNDNFGHVIGDTVICFVAEMFRTVFSETEIIGRIGGDEFAVFIPYKLEFNLLKEKLHKLCSPNKLENNDITISCSAGVCFAPDYGMIHKDLYNNADMALLSAKRNGKSRFEFFDNSTTLVTPHVMQEKTANMLDNVSEAMFVSDAITSKILYINETACNIVKKDKEKCLNKRCYELFWDSCQRCDRCVCIDQHSNEFYEETTYLKDHLTPVHIKARVEQWEDRKVKVHYLTTHFSPVSPEQTFCKKEEKSGQ